eukprot:2663722-Prymnesium_polylepis.1
MRRCDVELLADPKQDALHAHAHVDVGRLGEQVGSDLPLQPLQPRRGEATREAVLGRGVLLGDVDVLAVDACWLCEHTLHIGKQLSLVLLVPFLVARAHCLDVLERPCLEPAPRAARDTHLDGELLGRRHVGPAERRDGRGVVCSVGG